MRYQAIQERSRWWYMVWVVLGIILAIPILVVMMLLRGIEELDAYIHEKIKRRSAKSV